MNTGLSLFLSLFFMCVCIYIYMCVCVYFTLINLTILKLGGVIFRLLIEIIILLFTTHTPHQIA